MSMMPNGLLQVYNDKLARYERMCRWCDTASQAEQLQQATHIQQVIEDCNNVLNEVGRYREVTSDEIRDGFTI